MGENEKMCSRCKRILSLESFGLMSSTKDGRNVNCKKCRKEIVENNKNKNREINRLRELGVLPAIVNKKCTKCKEIKLISGFNKDGATIDGAGCWCKACHSEHGRAYGLKNVEKIRNKANEYSRKNAAKISAKRKERYKDPEVKKLVREKGIEYREKNKDAVRERRRSYFSLPEVKEHKSEYDKKRSQIYKPRRRPLIRAWARMKRATDPIHRLVTNIRTRLLRALKGKTKQGHTMDLVELTGSEWMDYLETTFWPGMTRQNDQDKKWEVDHIIPIDSFDKSDLNWQKKAFHWSNTQALWEKDNCTKRHRLDWSPLESVHELPDRFKRLSKSYWTIILTNTLTNP